MSGVRPTKRSLDDLGLSFPSLAVPLQDIEHELIAKAQRLPDEHASGGTERILSISDRLWFKVKVSKHRGAAGHVTDHPEDTPPLWWLVAAGIRRADSKGQDFYANLDAECQREARGRSTAVNSDHLLPQDIDFRRFRTEQVTLGVVALQQAVREAICRSTHSGQPVSATTNGQRLIVWVKSKEADTYLAISTEGFLDHNEIAIVLNAVPGMTADDWQIEPGEVLGITPGIGQLVYSAIIPPESLASIIEHSPGGYLQ